MIQLELVQPGPTTTLQDGGRVGAARFGVPRSGPVDALSHRLAARLAGFAADHTHRAVAVEVGPHPCTFGVVGGPLAIAVAGDGATADVDGTVLHTPCVVVLEPGERCTVHAATWAYVVPAGSLEVPAVLGSRSHHPRSGLGTAVAAGDRLVVTGVRQVRPGGRPAPATPGGPLHLLPAPQTSAFDEASRRALTAEAWRTTTAVDRMAARLEGPVLVAPDGHDIVSDGIVAGALQVPGDGQPWVLTADHQTTGGYPKIAVLAAADLARFVRVPPGDTVRFTWSDVATARQRLSAALDAVEACATAVPRPHGRALGRSNLIGGVADATHGEP